MMNTEKLAVSTNRIRVGYNTTEVVMVRTIIMMMMIGYEK
jgi:hypothetical protein